MTPSRLIGIPKRLERPQMRRSQTAASSKPPPTQTPRIDATVGWRRSARAVKHVGAVAIDQMQVLARTPCETNVRAMRRIAGRATKLEGLEKSLMGRLKKIAVMLDTAPENAPAMLARQRAKWIVPVPGLV